MPERYVKLSEVVEAPKEAADILDELGMLLQDVAGHVADPRYPLPDEADVWVERASKAVRMAARLRTLASSGLGVEGIEGWAYTDKGILHFAIERKRAVEDGCLQDGDFLVPAAILLPAEDGE